jgi:Flp pilus assembly protein TadG
MRVRIQRKLRRRSGAAAVELAFMLPVFTTLTFAQIEAARLGQVTQMLTIAARQGARVAVMAGKTQSDVQTAVDSVLANTGISVGTVSPSPSTWQTDPGGTLISVSLSVPYSQVSWISPSRYFGSVTLTGSATMSSERP